jgi:hypothetical protein
MWLDRGRDRPEVRVPVAGYILARDGRHCMITIGIDPHKGIVNLLDPLPVMGMV